MESNHEFHPPLKAEATFAEATGELMDAVSIQVTYFVSCMVSFSKLTVASTPNVPAMVNKSVFNDCICASDDGSTYFYFYFYNMVSFSKLTVASTPNVPAMVNKSVFDDCICASDDGCTYCYFYNYYYAFHGQLHAFHGDAFHGNFTHTFDGVIIVFIYTFDGVTNVHLFYNYFNSSSKRTSHVPSCVFNDCNYAFHGFFQHTIILV